MAEVEDRGTGESVLDRCSAAFRPDAEDEPALQSQLRLRHYIVKRRKPPSLTIEQEAMITQVIIIIGDEDIEQHTTK